MKPYYDHGGIVIYHGDCREVLPRLGPVDLVLTDPPYGIELATKTSDYRPGGHREAPTRASVLYRDDPEYVAELISQVFPFLEGMADRMVIFPGTHMLWMYPKPAAMGCVYTPNGAGRSRWGFQCMTPILFYGSDPYLKDNKGSRPNSFRTEQPNKERIDHPCPKPVSWMKWCVNRASRPGEMVLDPFMGSGTTLRAAKDLGRKAIGIEIEERYCEIAAKRLAQECFNFAEVV